MTGAAAPVAIELRGPLGVLRLARSEARNALDDRALRELATAARAAARTPGVRVLALTGDGPVFCAGGDLRVFAAWTGRRGGAAVARAGAAAVTALRRTGLPLVAAVNGDAYGGGCELAAACDVRIVERHARLHWVQGRMALTTGWGGTARLAAVVGPGLAARWLLAARIVDAAEAAAAGFADEVAATGTALDAALAFAQAVAMVPPATTRAQLALLRRGAAAPGGGAAERAAFERTWASRAHRDAVDRFVRRAR